MMPSAAEKLQAQALARLTAEVDRLSVKIDRLAETTATRADLARYAARETVETRWAEIDRRLGDVQNRVDTHETRLGQATRERLTSEMTWDWRVIGGLGCALSFLCTLLGTTLAGSLAGVIVWAATHH